MEHDLWNDDPGVMEEEADWGDTLEHEGEAAEDWDFYAFQQSSSSFSPCTTQYCKDKNISHTHSTESCYKLHHQKEKERHPKAGALFFSQKVTKAKARGKEKARANQAKAKAIAYPGRYCWVLLLPWQYRHFLPLCYRDIDWTIIVYYFPNM
jgi:hypothetical protein